MIDKFNGDAPPPVDNTGPFEEALRRLKSSWDLSSRAGAVRLLDYDLTIDNVLQNNLKTGTEASFVGKSIAGQKRLTYSRRSNPWRQLMEISLSEFPYLSGDSRVLKLDTGYLARQGVPLLRIVNQQDHPSALADVASLMLYLLRILVHVHLWSFRAPDKPKARELQRLPGRVPGLPEPVIREFPVDKPLSGKPVMVRLTQYPLAFKHINTISAI